MKYWIPWCVTISVLTLDITSKYLVYNHFDAEHTVSEEEPRGTFIFNNDRIRVVGDRRQEGGRDWLAVDLTINTGAIFGIGSTWLADNALIKKILMLILMSTAFIVVVYLFKQIPPTLLIPRAALGSILGGAIGNMSDRLFGYILYQGEWKFLFPGVVDWVVNPNPLSFDDQKGWGYYDWPIYNIADAAILIGLISLFSYIVISGKGDVIFGTNTKKPKNRKT